MNRKKALDFLKADVEKKTTVSLPISACKLAYFKRGTVGGFNNFDAGRKRVFKLVNMSDDNYLFEVILNRIYPLFNFFYAATILSAKAFVDDQSGERCSSPPG